MAPRPIFNATIGAFFRDLRESRGLRLRQAALIASQREIPLLSASKLSNLETGRIKHVTPEVLQSLAALYDVDYSELAARYSSLRFTTAAPPAERSPLPRIAPPPLPLKIARAAASLEVMEEAVREPILALIRETVARLSRRPSPARIAALAGGSAQEAAPTPRRVRRPLAQAGRNQAE